MMRVFLVVFLIAVSGLGGCAQIEEPPGKGTGKTPDPGPTSGILLTKSKVLLDVHYTNPMALGNLVVTVILREGGLKSGIVSPDIYPEIRVWMSCCKTPSPGGFRGGPVGIGSFRFDDVLVWETSAPIWSGEWTILLEMKDSSGKVTESKVFKVNVT